MHKPAILILGIVSIFALPIMLVIAQQSITGSSVVPPYNFFLLPDLYTGTPKHYPPLETLQLAPAEYDYATLPAVADLRPAWLSFEVNRIQITEPNYYYKFTLKKDRLHTYSGSAGYYEEDPREYVQGYLCAYAYKIIGAPLQCEQVRLEYINNRIGFARGYAPDEYIGYQAVGIEFGAVFILANPHYGVLEMSPVALLRWTN